MNTFFLNSIVVCALCVSASAMADTTGNATDSSAPAQALNSFSLTGSVEYSSGKYGGTTTTDILSVPVTARYATGRYQFSVTVPYISVSGSDIGIIPGAGRTGNMGTMGSTSGSGSGMMGSSTASTSTTSSQTARSGLGDIAGSLGYDIYTSEQLWLIVLGSVKFGTADPGKGLGTGKNDYAAEIDSAYSMHDTALLLAVGYKAVGKPTAYALNDIAYGSVGINQALGTNTRASLFFNVSQSSTSLSEGQRALTFGLTQQLGNIANWSLTLSKGMSSGSPDWAGGLGVSTSF